MDDLFENQEFDDRPEPVKPSGAGRDKNVPEDSGGEPPTGLGSMPDDVPPPPPPEPEKAPDQEVSPPVESDPRTYKLKTLQLEKIDAKIDSVYFGATLKRLRESHRLTLQDLAERTMISVNYLSAIEEQNFDHLPQPVYIAAYIRKLGFIYNLNDEEVTLLTSEVKAKINPETPQGDDIEKVVVNYEESEENAHKIRRIVWSAAAMLTVTLALAALGVNMLFGRAGTDAPPVTSTSSGVKSVFDPGTLLEVQSKPELKPALLELPRQ